jgi:metal-responsive CopG/Arc/MetJ family transcriptional regulator
MYFSAESAHIAGMEPPNQIDFTLPPALLAEVEAMAAGEHRSARDILREAVESYVQARRPFAGVNGVSATPQRSAQEAAARMLERRKLHSLPEGISIRDLMTFGRA